MYSYTLGSDIWHWSVETITYSEAKANYLNVNIVGFDVTVVSFSFLNK